MDRLIYTAMSGAKQAFLQQAGVAQNLANATTVGYRAMEHRFRAVPVLGAKASRRAPSRSTPRSPTFSSRGR
jgi:flagellar basal-body rod protein FlgF